MTLPTDLQTSLLAAWRTNSRVTAYLVEQISEDLWAAKLLQVPTRSIRAIAAHLHNSRCRWTKTLGAEHGIVPAERVDHHSVAREEILPALERSARGIGALLELGLRHGGSLPPSKAYTWRNLPLDVGHVLTYFSAHEAHHRGQIVMAARQLGLRLPGPVTSGLWQWRTREREAPAPPRTDPA